MVLCWCGKFLVDRTQKKNIGPNYMRIFKIWNKIGVSSKTVWKSCVTYKFESDRMISGSRDHKNDDREKRVCWYRASWIKNCEWFSNKSPEAKKK